MHSLSELRNFFVARGIQIQESTGWSLKVGNDTWTLCHDVYYLNNSPHSVKEKVLTEYCKTIAKVVVSKNKKKWKGINGGRVTEDT